MSSQGFSPIQEAKAGQPRGTELIEHKFADVYGVRLHRTDASARPARAFGTQRT